MALATSTVSDLHAHYLHLSQMIEAYTGQTSDVLYQPFFFSENYFRFVAVHVFDRQTHRRTDRRTDRQTDCSSQVRGCVAAARHSTRRQNVAAFHTSAWAAIMNIVRNDSAGQAQLIMYRNLKWVSVPTADGWLVTVLEKPSFVEKNKVLGYFRFLKFFQVFGF